MVSPITASPFSPLIGQPQAVALLEQTLARQRVAPGYLFVGPEGVGRALAATGFAASLLAPKQGTPGGLRQRIQSRNHPDLLWVEPTYLHQGKLLTATEAQEAGLKRKSRPQIRLEQIRAIGRFLSQPPLESSRSVVVIEKAELMAEAAANGLLKTLEEPGQATLILLAADKQVLLSTLISRCQIIPFVRLSTSDMAQILIHQGYGDILDNPQILALAQGSPGSAIASWQQLQAIPPDLLTRVTDPLTCRQAALDIARQITQALDTEAQLWLLDYLQHHHWQHPQPAIVPVLETLEQARKYLLSYVQPRLVWEVTLMGLVL
jgi:DNA polymerase-3 subunit delta'